MSQHPKDGGGSNWPSAGLLLLCVALPVAGYGVAVLRGPAPAREVRVVAVPAPTPAPETAPVAE